MYLTLPTPQQRRACLLASSILATTFSFGISTAHAQQTVAATTLPPVEIIAPVEETRTRIRTVVTTEEVATRRVATGSPARNSKPKRTRSAKRSATKPDVAAGSSTATAVVEQAFSGIVGASNTVITAADIAHSPAQTLPEILAQVPGIQIQTLYGGVAGAQTMVDLRGFGAFATANSLVLINGRRVNDADLQGVNFSAIPRDSIERIEITRGNSGAVLYGDNAVGGVINIITKTGVTGPAYSGRAEVGVGSFNQLLSSISATAHQGPWSTSIFGSATKSDGYRDNNALRQENGVGELRYTTPDFTAFLNLSGDNQHLGFPGGRYNIAPSYFPDPNFPELTGNRKGTSTPFDYGNQQGANATAGFTKIIANGVELIVDGGVRDKKQQAGFFGSPPVQDYNESYVDTHLLTWSLTPRLSIKNTMFGLPSNILTGIDYYDATYHSNRSETQYTSPIHVYDLTQKTLGAYWQQTLGILPSTDFSYGARVQQTSVSARDTLDMSAPGYFDIGNLQADPLNSTEVNHALHIGLEHRFNDIFSVFGRAASAFRTPNVDERVAAGGPQYDPTTFAPLPRSFALKTQTSEDIEGGFRIKAGRFAMQSSIYGMDLTNEIHYNPVQMFNYNLDPTRRYGSETSATYQASDTVLLRGGFAYTRAIYREGPFAGNDVPLVSRYSANAGISWNAWQRYLVVDATVRYWSSRHMDNDQPNDQPLIPANATVDFKLSGEYQKFFWSFTVSNVFNALYYDYAIASASSLGVFSAYPLPGRTWLLKAGVNF